MPWWLEYNSSCLFLKIKFLSLGDIDFATTTVYPTADDFLTLPNVKFIPGTLFATAPAYNVRAVYYIYYTFFMCNIQFKLDLNKNKKKRVMQVPELAGKEPLILTIQLVADIYMGHIAYWNDSAIADLNPHLKDYLPNKPLLVVYEPGTSTIAGQITKVLATIPEFNRTVSV